ncbi:MAG: hypothetical protein H6744_06215 [Deltaproteobacteria bacterium]|nr:hypothetical protein [Deltaproteobacteria bacterium]MCB9786274.1 hypothetical protein [Deltaproteobacteria bacterium]
MSAAPELPGRPALHRDLLDFVARPDPTRFDALASRVVRFQAATVEAYGRLCRARHDGPLTHWRDAPRVPTELFRDLDLSNLAPDEPEAACFRTSGTTGPGRRGARRVRDLGLYHAGMVEPFVSHVLAGERQRRPWLCLVPDPRDAPGSSLGHMVAGLATDLAAPASLLWALGPEGLDVAAAWLWLEARTAEASPAVVLGTSFAIVSLLDAEPARRVRLPAGSRLMLTGGFKGRSRTLDEDALSALVTERLGLDAEAIVPEYGMTELTSQAYGRPLEAPPWLRLEVVDPLSLAPLPPGERGLVACFDLLALDNVSALLTGDLGTLDAAGRLTLHGRAPGAVLRGCSLTAEELGVLTR